MLFPLVELAGDDGRGNVLSATVDGERGAGGGALGGHVGEADRAADTDAGATAGDGADRGRRGSAVDDGVTVAGDRALGVGDLEAGERALDACGLLRAQRVG